MRSIRVILADDHAGVRVTIRKFLDNAPGIEVVGEASNGIETLRLVEEFAPDVLLLDVEMPQMTGLEVIRRLQATKSLVSILVLSAYDDWPYIQGMLKTGASGYLTKAEAPEFIVEAVRGVAQGEQGWIGRQVARQILAWPAHILREPVQIALTEQEKAVLRLVVDGKTDREIGRALDLSEKLVETYLETMFAKLGVTSRAMAVKRARQKGIISEIL